MAAVEVTAPARARGTRDWVVVATQELRDLWIGGRGMLLCFAFSLLLGALAYLSATNEALNFLERREAVSLMVQVTVAVGALLALLAGADAISGERERGTLETLLLTPVSRRHIATGKLVVALTLWFATFAITVPYVWLLGRGVAIVGDALAVGLVVGTLLAVFLTSLGVVLSIFAASNRVSLSLSLFILFALFAPTLFPTGARQGWAGDFLYRTNPMTAGEDYVGKIVVSGHAWSQDLSLLVSPLVAAVVCAAVAAILSAGFIHLRGGVSG